MGINLANIEATRQAESKDAELQREVETKRAEMELERRRATDLVQAKIQKESEQEKAEAKYYTDTKNADAYLYKQRQEIETATYRASKEAEAQAFRVTKEVETQAFRVTKEAETQAFRVTKEAEAAYFRASREAEATLLAKMKEAEATMEMAKAYGHMADVLGGPQGYVFLFDHPPFPHSPRLVFHHTHVSPFTHQNNSLLQYMLLQTNTYEKLARQNATALQGLQPKISVWNTGSADAEGANPTAPISNLLKSLPPLLSTIHDQTGISPPSWLANMPPQYSGSAVVPAGAAKAKAKTDVNGYAG